MSSGASLGLQQRAANQRDAEMAQRMQLAEMQAAQEQANAAERLRYNYDALMQARDLAMRDDAARKEQNEFSREIAAAKLLQEKAESDALAAYREGTLKNQADRNAYLKGKPEAAKTFHVADSLVQVNPDGTVKTLFSRSPEDKIPMVSGVPVIADDPASAKLRLRADDPLLNKLMGTNAALLGTNYVAPMPKVKVAPVAQAPVAPAVAEDLEGDEDGGPAQPLPEAKPLDKATAAQFLKAAGGDKTKARELARQAGYTF